MPADMLTRNERTASQPTPIASDREDEFREWARKHVERVRKLKLNVAAYVLGMAVLTAVWALVEWQDNGAFERFSGGNNPGDWEPWILYPALIWGFFVAIDVLKTYFDRPTTEAEIDREIRRLRPGGYRPG
ncbi:MAG: 2TM domain-containing protein [Gaiellaceae bacterium]